MRRFPALLNVIGPLLGLLLVIGLFSISAEVRPYFLSGANFKIIFTQTVVVAICAMGMTLVIVSGGLDLSVGSVVALCSVVGATLLLKQVSVPVVILATIAVGGLVGIINGTIIGQFKMMPFIVTLGMMGVARGMAKWIAGNQAVYFPESSLNNLMALREPDSFFPLPHGVWIAIGIGLVMVLVIRETVFGRYIFAIGSNETAARLSGIPVARQKLYIYGAAGVLFGIAGLMQLSRLSQGDPTAAIGLELDVIAAVVIGGASLSGGSGSLAGALIGALIMTTLRNGSNQMGWHNYVQEIIIGTVIILAVGLDRLRKSSEK